MIDMLVKVAGCANPFPIHSPSCLFLFFSLIIVLLKGPSISLGAFGANNGNYVQIKKIKNKKIKSIAMIKIYLLNASENFASFLVESV